MKSLGILIATITVLAAAPCLAQVLEVSYDSPLGGTGSVSTTVVADFDGDGLEDVAYLRGTQVTIVTAPGLYAQSLTITEAGDVTAITALSGDPRDELLVADEYGLSAWRIDPVTGLESRVIGTESWTNARSITTGKENIYGLSSDGLQFGTIIDTVESWHTNLLPATDVLEVVWDTQNTTEELAILIDDPVLKGLLIKGAAGNDLEFFWTPHKVEDLAVCLVNATSEKEQVIAIGKSLDGVTDGVGFFEKGVLPIHVDLSPTIDAVGISTGDLDDNGTVEILISHKSSDSLLFLSEPFPPTPPFQFVGPSEGNPLSAASPAILDLDQDGDLDVVHLFEESSSATFRSILQEAEPQSPPENSLIAADPLKPVVSFYFADSNNTPNSNERYFCFELSNPPSGIPAGANHIEVGLWEKVWNGTSFDAPVPAGHTSIPVSTGREAVITTAHTGASTESVFVWAARYIVGNPDTHVYSRQYPSVMKAFTAVVLGEAPPDDVSLIELESLSRDTLVLTQDPDDGFSTLAPGYTRPSEPPPGSPEADSDLPFNTGTNTPVRPLPSPEELPDPKFGDTAR